MRWFACVLETRGRDTLLIELYIRDPGGVYDELHFAFGPWSSNNPHYHIDALAKMIQDNLRVPVSYEKKPEEPECPF